MWHCVCVFAHSFPLKIELEVERTHMTNDEGIYFRRYSRDGKLASEGGKVDLLIKSDRITLNLSG